MKLTMLGTGNAMAIRCYNTCFALSEREGGEVFLVDAGGGNQILRILQEEKLSFSGIHNFFVSHAHTDHVLGVIWVIRMIGQMINAGKYQGDLKVFCHRELAEVIADICKMMLQEKVTRLFGDRIRFIRVEDGQKESILDTDVEFMDILSTKMKQYGFLMTFRNGTRFSFCGDEPLNKSLFHRVEGSDWMLHEAFCLYDERDIFKPYEKHHSTVKDACELAEKLKVKNLILYHTEDTHIQERKRLYSDEGKRYYTGTLFVPEDREVIDLGASDGENL